MLNNFAGSRLNLESPDNLKDFQPLDRVTLNCSLTHIHLLICDLGDLYEDSYYVSSHKLKTIPDFDMKAFLSLPYHI